MRNMKRFIITGAPGAGKTAIIRHLELDGFGVVEEAATDIIAAAHARGGTEPWKDPPFIDAIARLQRERENRGSYLPDEVQFHDRSVICTAALAVYLGHAQSPFLASELERIRREGVYEQKVAISVTSHPPKPGVSASRRACNLKRSMKIPTADSGSKFSI